MLLLRSKPCTSSSSACQLRPLAPSPSRFTRTSSKRGMGTKVRRVKQGTAQARNRPLKPRTTLTTPSPLPRYRCRTPKARVKIPRVPTRRALPHIEGAPRGLPQPLGETSPSEASSPSSPCLASLACNLAGTRTTFCCLLCEGPARGARITLGCTLMLVILLVRARGDKVLPAVFGSLHRALVGPHPSPCLPPCVSS